MTKPINLVLWCVLGVVVVAAIGAGVMVYGFYRSVRPDMMSFKVHSELHMLKQSLSLYRQDNDDQNPPDLSAWLPSSQYPRLSNTELRYYPRRETAPTYNKHYTVLIYCPAYYAALMTDGSTSSIRHELQMPSASSP